MESLNTMRSYTIVRMPEAVQNVSKERIKYIIFGCGSTGYNVAEELGQESEDLVIVDKDEKRVEIGRASCRERVLVTV